MDRRTRRPDRRADEGAVVEIETKGLRADLSTAVWRTSTRSSSSCDSCVEVAFVNGAIAVRDSRTPDSGILIFTPEEWDAFVEGTKDGEFGL
jgi:hypothetical protein